MLDSYCVTDGGRGGAGNYGNSERCTITVHHLSTVSATEFVTQSCTSPRQRYMQTTH